MLTILRIVFSIITLVLAGYGLVTNNTEYQAYLELSLGLLMLIMGIDEIKQGRKGWGYFFLLLFALISILSIQRLI